MTSSEPPRGERKPSAEAEPAWHWPVALATYDQSPVLSRVEASALAYLVPELDKGRPWPARLAEGLHRLFQPVEDALAMTGATGEVQTAALRAVAREIHRRQRSVWAWTPSEWVETLGTTERQFRQRHRGRPEIRQHLIALSYLLCGFTDWNALGTHNRVELARKVFGAPQVDAATQQVCTALLSLGYRPKVEERVRVVLCEALLVNRSPRLGDLSPTLLDELRTCWRQRRPGQATGWYVLAQALFSLGFIDHPLPPASRREPAVEPTTGVAVSWVQWCQRWRDTSTLPPHTRHVYYRLLLRAGRWLTHTHPEAVTPEQWTRELAAEYVAAVNRLVVGQWTREDGTEPAQDRPPLSARSKESHLTAVRAFFHDCQEWGWIARRFDPRRSFATPRAVLALLGPNPRVIADDIWAKLLWAGLNLTETDLTAPVSGPRGAYPLSMVRALAIVWLFAGLRRNEIRRLRMGCVRWQMGDGSAVDGGQQPIEAATCLLDVPVHKTGPGFTKPVDRLVGEAILAWERVRPQQPALLDPKTGEMVQYVFAYRGRRIGEQYLNDTLIPVLCHKAGLPERDARGAITSHRARATIASQLFNAKEPLSLFELQAWLGHRSPSSTQHYAKLTPTKLAKAYAAADYFARNVRSIEVLLDQEAIMSGAAAAGQPWRFYDLGHGYCSYQFFDQCPHRMACAKCTFYVPKGSGRAQALEGKTHLLRMLHEIPLTEDERAAVEDGVAAFDRLLTQLADVPTPPGPTPRRLASDGILELHGASQPNLHST